MIRALGTLVVAFAMSWSTCAVGAKPLTAILLSARADLPDPNFADSVVLVMNHIAPAPVGVIVNRPTRIPVSRLFPELERLTGLDDKVYFGGPVDIQSVFFLFRAATPPDNATEVLDGVYMSTDRELLRELLSRDKPMEGLRVFVGYAGWAPGQLEGEIARGDWTLTPAESSAIFDRKSERPWPGQRPGAGQRASRREPNGPMHGGLLGLETASPLAPLCRPSAPRGSSPLRSEALLPCRRTLA